MSRRSRRLRSSSWWMNRGQVADSQIKFFEHPEYKALSSKWQTYRDLFEGDHATLTSYRYLWEHELEKSSAPIPTMLPTGESAPVSEETVGQRIRRIRAQRSRYYNLIEPIISTYIAMAFKKAPRADSKVEALLEDAINDIDGQGTSLQNFIMNQVAVSYFRDGRPILLVDAPENKARSRQEEKESGFRPFFDILDVLQVKDWQFQDKGQSSGKYELLRYEFKVIAPRTSMHDEPKEITYCKVYTLMREEGAAPSVVIEIFRQDDKGKWSPAEEPQFLPGWQEVPISTIHGNDSWIKDASELQLVLFNLMSAYYNLLNTQAFQRIMVAGEMGQKHSFSVSEYAISFIPTGAVPHVISPADTTPLTEGVLGTVDKMYRVAFNRTRGLASDSKEAPAANTLREMHEELVNLLLQAVGEIEDLVNLAIKHYAMFKLGPEKGSAFDGKVTLSRDITVEDVAQRLELFAMYRDEIRKVLPWRKAELKKVATSMNYGDEEMEEILKGIESLKDEPLMDPLTGLGAFMNGGQREEQETEEEAEEPGEEAGRPAREPGRSARLVA